MTPSLSVLICTYNPKEPLLRRTLDGLARQSLARDRWELLLVDNASTQPVRERYDLSWHPHGRHVFAGKLGKTHAIAEAMRGAAGQILVIVDDDNVLAPDYLETAERIFLDHPFMGAAGGVLEGEFESPPPDWAAPYLVYLAVFRRGDRPCYAFTPDTTLVCPGAGMVIRRPVVEHYLRLVADDPVRQAFDPVGEKLSRSGDSDMMLCAYDVGLAKGFFPELRLTHLIPSARLCLDYLVRLREEGAYCGVLLDLVRGLWTPPGRGAVWVEFLRTFAKLLLTRPWYWQRFRMEWVTLRGSRRACRDFAAMRTASGQASSSAAT